MARSPRPVRLLGGLLSLAALLVSVGPLRGHAFSLARGVTVGGAPDVVYTRADAGGPVVWQGCATVRVLVNPGPFGEEAASEIRSAFAEVAALTGLQFEFSPSTRVPRTDWALAHGDWEVPPVLVAWVDPAATDLIGASASGATVANPARSADGRRRIVTGAIALDAGEYDSYGDAPGAGRTRRNLILHEIGHLLGLDHAHGSGLMDPVVGGSSPDGFHAREAASLRAVYAPARCGG